MIKSDMGSVHIEGNDLAIRLDMILIIRAFLEGVGGKLGEEKANEMLAECGRIAVMEEDEMHKAVADLFSDDVKDILKPLVDMLGDKDDE